MEFCLAFQNVKSIIVDFFYEPSFEDYQLVFWVQISFTRPEF